jgi:hypothetical protein
MKSRFRRARSVALLGGEFEPLQASTGPAWTPQRDPGARS